MFLLQMFIETLVNPKMEEATESSNFESGCLMKIQAPHLLSVGNLKQVI